MTDPRLQSESSNAKSFKPMGFLRLYIGGRYIWIMSGLFLMLIIGPLVGRFEIVSSHIYIGDLVIGLLLVAAARAFTADRTHFTICLWLGSIAIVAGIAGRYLPAGAQSTMVTIALVLDTLFLLYLILLICADVFSTLDVDADTICGSISVYLLISGVFASIYTILVTLDASAFLIPGPPADPDYSLGPDRLMTYFSLITITTVGYGDVTPQSEFARSLSNLEALIGQVFLTVLVARLVGRQLSGVGRRSQPVTEETGD
ncbi:MAG: hypothetical protein CMJ54_12215 [Planctomycetaceae bacterium]|nr:hypothetical protein [Planctomycetaceae bacterium]